MPLSKLPRQLPPLSALLRDLGDPKPAALARALGVSERTVWRWLADDDAPRPVLLALFWLTSWGWSAIEAEARQTIELARGLAAAMGRERDALAAENARLQRLGTFGSANDPTGPAIGAPRPGIQAAAAIAPQRHGVLDALTGTEWLRRRQP